MFVKITAGFSLATISEFQTFQTRHCHEMIITATIGFRLASCPFLTFKCVKEETVIYKKLQCYMTPTSTNLSKAF